MHLSQAIMDQQLKQEALDYLEELYKNTPYEKSGEEYLRRIEWKIRQNEGELLDSIIAALELWLKGDDHNKAEYAIHLMGRLGAKQYLPELEKLLHDMNENKSRLPNYWKSFVQGVINQLNRK